MFLKGNVMSWFFYLVLCLLSMFVSVSFGLVLAEHVVSVSFGLALAEHVCVSVFWFSACWACLCQCLLVLCLLSMFVSTRPVCCESVSHLRLWDGIFGSGRLRIGSARDTGRSPRLIALSWRCRARRWIRRARGRSRAAGRRSSSIARRWATRLEPDSPK